MVKWLQQAAVRDLNIRPILGRGDIVIRFL
jgi:hypothetical protein